jgi:Tetratricopeptide repeat
MATSLNNLAWLYYARPKAEPLYRRALAICEKALGPEHPNVATSLETTRSFSARWPFSGSSATGNSRARHSGWECLIRKLQIRLTNHLQLRLYHHQGPKGAPGSKIGRLISPH